MAHPGKKETVQKIADRYYWPNMKSDIHTFVSQCVPCNTCKPKRTIIPPLDSRPVMPARFNDVMLDLVGPLPASDGMQYLLTAVCRTSRWLEAMPMPDATSANACKAFIDGWIRNFGLPAKITCDNGKTFTSQLWKDINKQLNTIVAYTPIYSPASLGSLERQHADLKSGIKASLVAMGDRYQGSWMRCLPWVLLGRRTAYHGELQATPSQAVFGEDVRLPGDLTPPLASGETIQELLQRVKTNAERPPSQTAPHKVLPVHMPPSTETCTKVWTRRAKTTPLSPIWDGPYPIIRKLGKSCLEIQVGRVGQMGRHGRHAHVRAPETTSPARK